MNALAQLNAAPAALDAAAPNDLLDQIVEQSRVAKSEAEHARARDLIAQGRGVHSAVAVVQGACATHGEAACSKELV